MKLAALGAVQSSRIPARSSAEGLLVAFHHRLKYLLFQMRLLRRLGNGDFSLVEYFSDIPPYAILSHTWLSDSKEVTFKDIIKSRGKSKEGYKKLQFCAQQAAHDKLDYFWVDTCCIDKSSSAELSEAINSMFRWYQCSAKCYVYMSDVSSQRRYAWDMTTFRNSRWFTRGWTLQELIAPKSVEFFSKEGTRLGDKISLLRSICGATGIPAEVVLGCSLSRYTDEVRLSWAEKRNTKREEDAAYSLMGLFDVHMIPIYGEGRLKAFKRLRYETMQARNATLYSFVLSVWPEEVGNEHLYTLLRMNKLFTTSALILFWINFWHPFEDMVLAPFPVFLVVFFSFSAYIEKNSQARGYERNLTKAAFGTFLRICMDRSTVSMLRFLTRREERVPGTLGEVMASKIGAFLSSLF